MKTEFENRISFRKLRDYRKRVIFEAHVYWGNKHYETIRATKEKCISELMHQTDVVD